jgi:hypothetical protein
MKLRETRVEVTGDVVRLVGSVEHKGTVLELYFAFPRAFESFVVNSADAFVPTLLVPCLQRGEALEIEPPVSPLLLSRVGQVQDIYLSWFPSFRRVALSARPRPGPEPPPAAGVGAFFSGGVDSFYTLLRPQGGPLPRPTHLLFLKGIEQPLALSRGTEAVQATVQEAARRTGTSLVPGESNIRDHFSLNYELYYNGAALVAAALALQGGLGLILVPSSYAYSQLKPWGTHPLLDPLWATERLRVVHDGCEARRVDKIEALIGEPLVLEQLRVCLENAAGPANCGRCPKCVRTMLALEILGVLPRASRFPQRLPPDVDVLFSRDHQEFRDELVELAHRIGRRRDLAFLLDRASRRARRRAALRTFMEETPVLASTLPWIQRLRKRTRAALS